jgi:hypothetical protein
VIEGKRVIVDQLGVEAWNVWATLNPDRLQKLLSRDWDK